MLLEPFREVWFKVTSSGQGPDLDLVSTSSPLAVKLKNNNEAPEDNFSAGSDYSWQPKNYVQVPQELIVGDIIIEEQAGYVTQVTLTVRSLAILNTSGDPTTKAIFPFMNPALLGDLSLRCAIKCGYWKNPFKTDKLPVWRWYMIDGILTSIDPGIGTDGIPEVHFTFQNYAYRLGVGVRSLVKYPTGPGEAKLEKYSGEIVTTNQLLDVRQYPSFAIKEKTGDSLSVWEIIEGILKLYGYLVEEAKDSGIKNRLSLIKYTTETPITQQNQTDWAFLCHIGKLCNVNLFLDSESPASAAIFKVGDYRSKTDDEEPVLRKQNPVMFCNFLFGDFQLKEPVAMVNTSDPTNMVTGQCRAFALLSPPNLRVPNAGYTQRKISSIDIQSGNIKDDTSMESVQRIQLLWLSLNDKKIWQTVTDPKTHKASTVLTPEAKAVYEKLCTDLSSATWNWKTVEPYFYSKDESLATKVEERGFKRYLWKGWELSFETVGNPWSFIGFHYPVLGLSSYYSGQWILKSMTHTIGNFFSTSYEFYR